jgi:2-isopropylmalate synthase
MRNLTIFDTTLRDGDQAPGYAMSLESKLKLAALLQELRVDVIELGFPAASHADFVTVSELAPTIELARACVFSRATERDIELATRASEAAPDREIELLASVSDIHLQYKRRICRTQALEEIVQAVRHARGAGFRHIAPGLEDATRADRAFLREVCLACVEAGATKLVLPDTVGCLLPHQMKAFIADVRSWIPESVTTAVHAHNDLGLATANTLAAVESGVDEVQTTLCGIGERAGNASLEEVVAALVSHRDFFGVATRVVTGSLCHACSRLGALLGKPIPAHKPVIGENAFATAAGIHQIGVLRAPQTYEFLDPEVFGARRRIVLSRHSGRAAIAFKLQAMNFMPTEDLVERVYRRVVEGSTSAQPLVSDETLLCVAREEKLVTEVPPAAVRAADAAESAAELELASP